MGIELQSGWPLQVGVALWATLLAEQGKIADAVRIFTLHAQDIPGQKMAEDVIYRHFKAVTANAPAEVVAAAQSRGEARTLLAMAQEILAEIERRC